MKFFLTSIRAKHQNLESSPNIDPTDPNLLCKVRFKVKIHNEFYLRQQIYIHHNAGKFFNYVERKVLKKFISDVGYILNKSWADEISLEDFYGGLVCGKKYRYSTWINYSLKKTLLFFNILIVLSREVL